MTFASPILGLLALPVMIAIAILARRLPTLRARVLVRLAAAFLLGAIGGVSLRVDRQPRIAVMVDVSPSTRTATFRDGASVTARLTPLLNGRPYMLHYFGDGLQKSGDELNVSRTRLEIPNNVDHVILLSDGRFDVTQELPPTYPVIDPALDNPADGRIVDVRVGDRSTFVYTAITGQPRRLSASGSAAVEVSGNQVVQIASNGLVKAELNSADAWPENDSMTAVASAAEPMRRLAVGLDLPGFLKISPQQLASERDLIDVRSIVLNTTAELPAAAAKALSGYIKDFGGTLICVGQPRGGADAIAAMSPLTADPPMPQNVLTLLLDASGSMGVREADGRTRWAIALQAAERAVATLPTNSLVNVMTFARSLDAVLDQASPADAMAALARLAEQVPSGPTGLRAALEEIAARSGGAATRLLLLSDADASLGDVDALATSLRAKHVTLFALTTHADVSVDRLAAATGGRSVLSEVPAAWANDLAALSASVNSAASHEGTAVAIGAEELSGFDLRLDRYWDSWPRQGATVLANVGQAPVVARWQNALGRVISVTADFKPADLSALAMKLEQPGVDPRFNVVWADANDRVTLSANEGANAMRPMNGLAPVLVRDGANIPFEQIGPGRYEAPLARSAQASNVAVTIAGRTIGRAVLPGHYPAEFDAIGNDVAALENIARRSGGAVIAPGDQRPIQFAQSRVEYDLKRWLAGAAALCLCAAIGSLQAPPAKP